MSGQKKGKLYLIPTPLSSGALDRTTTPYQREVIGRTRYFLVENERTARRYISALELGVDIGQLVLERLDKYTPRQDVHAFLEKALPLEDVCVLSEAGCPGIADPGSLAVEIAHQMNFQVIPLVGPSSILMALMAAGFNGQSFVFHGYLPIDRVERIHRIRKMEKNARSQTQIFMETPYRNDQLLMDLLTTCASPTRLCIASNITADGEWIKTYTINDWRSRIPKLNKQPSIFLLYAGD